MLPSSLQHGNRNLLSVFISLVASPQPTTWRRQVPVLQSRHDWVRPPLLVIMAAAFRLDPNQDLLNR
jgi:hypothetical protein